MSIRNIFKKKKHTKSYFWIALYVIKEKSDVSLEEQFMPFLLNIVKKM